MPPVPNLAAAPIATAHRQHPVLVTAPEDLPALMHAATALRFAGIQSVLYPPESKIARESLAEALNALAGSAHAHPSTRVALRRPAVTFARATAASARDGHRHERYPRLDDATGDFRHRLYARPDRRGAVPVSTMLVCADAAAQISAGASTDGITVEYDFRDQRRSTALRRTRGGGHLGANLRASGASPVDQLPPVSSGRCAGLS